MLLLPTGRMRNLRVSQMSPASASSTASSTVTPHSSMPSSIAQSSELGPRSPWGPGCTTRQVYLRHTDSGMNCLSIGHTTRSGLCASTEASMISGESTTWTVTSCPISVRAMYARWLRLLCADVTNRMRSGFSATDVGTSPRRRPGLRRRTSSKFLGGSMRKGIDARDACLETDWTDYGLMACPITDSAWLPILRGAASFHARVWLALRGSRACGVARGACGVYARRRVRA